MTDRYLQGQWSKGVRATKGEICLHCGNPAHSCHHIIKRRYMVLRYDMKNGIPLCSTCHRVADRNTGFALGLIDVEDAEYLNQMGMHTLKDWLMLTHQTRDEFLKGCADELKAAING